jgi:hypothetical protein
MLPPVLLRDPGPAGPIGPPYDEWWEHFGRDAGIPYEPPRALREGEEIQANGGRIEKRVGLPPPGYQSKPPYYVRYAGPATSDGFVEAGPFADAQEAFDYGTARYGGRAPSIGHVEVLDSEGWIEIIT